jgi:hypothetical protein
MLVQFSVVVAVLVGVVLGAGGPAVAHAQETMVVDDSGSGCPGCKITLDRLVSFGSTDGPDLLGLWPVVTRAPSGRYLLADESNDAQILVFDSTGTFLHAAGGRGQGPGEYGFIRFLQSVGEHTYVFDDRTRRITVLDENLEVVGTTALPAPLLYSVAVLPPGTPVLATFAPTREHAAFPFHLVDDRGQIAHAFGDDTGFRPDLVDQWARVITGAGKEAIWATKRREYSLELWQVDGRLERRIERRPAWFTPMAAAEIPSQENPPPSTIFAIQMDGEGLIWTLTGVAGRRWRDGVRALDGTHAVIVDDPGLYWDTVIEVIDPVRGELVASETVDAFLHTFAGERLAVSQSLEQGVPRSHVWRLQVSGR